MLGNKIKIDGATMMILVLILFSQLFFLNGVYLFISLLVLYIGLYQLQQPYKASVFTFIFFYHFLQIIAGVWQATYLENDINYRSNSMGFATVTSLLGLVVMFCPIIYYHNKIPKMNIEALKKHASKLSLNKTFYAYIIAFFVTGSLNGVRFLFPGYTQFIITIVGLKWFFFLLLGFQCILKNKRKKEFYFFITLEFLLGLYSFFSDFKTVVFFVAALYIVFVTNITVRKFLLAGTIGIITFFAATLWTSIKVDYRKFLNKGERSQNVSVSQNEALNKLYELTISNRQNIGSSTTAAFLDRLQATFFLAKTMDRVPYLIPYQNGKNWSSALEFVFTPRLFNPDKPVLDASKKTSRYTGIEYAGYSQGASFSLGYFADSYVDFGIFGVFILFIIGLIYGISYLYFLRNSSPNYIFNFSIVCALYMRFIAMEMDNVFFIGTLFTDLFVYFLLSKFFFPWLYRFLLAPKESID